jgi:hypothetical protein
MSRSAGEVIRLAPNDPQARRKERLARYRGKSVDEGLGTKAANDLQFFGKVASLFE